MVYFPIHNHTNKDNCHGMAMTTTLTMTTNSIITIKTMTTAITTTTHKIRSNRGSEGNNAKERVLLFTFFNAETINF